MEAVFLETSALLSALFREPRGQEAERVIRSAPHIIASRLLKLETERALIRAAQQSHEFACKLPDFKREAASIWPIISFIEISREVCDLAGKIAPETQMRSLDAIHLATFTLVREAAVGIRMLSFDERILAYVY